MTSRFLLETSTLLDDGTLSPSKQYREPFYTTVSGEGHETVGEDTEDDPTVLNTERLRDLPPRDILVRAFHGTSFRLLGLYPMSYYLFYHSLCFSEQPIQLDPRTPTFLLGLEQVIALVDATGKKVGNQVADKLTSEKLFQSTYLTLRGFPCLSLLYFFMFLFSFQLHDTSEGDFLKDPQLVVTRTPQGMRILAVRTTRFLILVLGATT